MKIGKAKTHLRAMNLVAGTPLTDAAIDALLAVWAERDARIEELEATNRKLHVEIECAGGNPDGYAGTDGRLAKLVAERDMWKREAALWSGDRTVALPDGWVVEATPRWSIVLSQRFRDRVAYVSNMSGAVEWWVCVDGSPVTADFCGPGGETWHEAMTAAEKAAKEQGDA